MQAHTQSLAPACAGTKLGLHNRFRHYFMLVDDPVVPLFGFRSAALLISVVCLASALPPLLQTQSR